MSLTYLICRTHGYASRLLGRDLIRRLAAARSLRQLAEELSETEYGPSLKTAQTILDFEEALAEVFVSRSSALLGLAPGGIGDFIKSYLRRYEVQNLVWIARMKLGGASEGEIARMLMPVKGMGVLDLEDLVKAGSLDELIKAVRSSGAYRLPEEVESVAELEAELWKSYYAQIFKKLSLIPLSDRGDVKSMLGLELDLINLKTCMLSAAGKLDREIAEKLLIDNPAGVPRRKLVRLLSKGDERIFLEHFPGYRDFLMSAISGGDWLLEVERFRIVRRFAESLRIPRFVNFFYVMKYLVDLEAEYRDLRTIAIAIHHGVPPESRLRLLVSV